jgi:hypothetical protein
MELFIQIHNGASFEHPILGDNFRQAFPEIDVNNLPPEFAKFIRVEPPQIGVYEIYEGVTYEKVGDFFTDVHHVRPMTNEEKINKQEVTKQEWVKTGYNSWFFNQETCSFDPPTPYPNDNKIYTWDEPSLSWVEVTP